MGKNPFTISNSLHKHLLWVSMRIFDARVVSLSVSHSQNTSPLEWDCGIQWIQWHNRHIFFYPTQTWKHNYILWCSTALCNAREWNRDDGLPSMWILPKGISKVKFQQSSNFTLSTALPIEPKLDLIPLLPAPLQSFSGKFSRDLSFSSNPVFLMEPGWLTDSSHTM